MARVSLPAQAKEMYLGGATVRQVAEAHNLSISTLRRLLTAEGVTLRRYTGKRPGAQPKIDRDRLAKLADGTRSTRELSALLGVSEECVRRNMIRLGIDRLPAKARPERNYFWKTGRTVDKHGYVSVLARDHPLADSGGYVREHRLVMEEHLGRYLLPTEVVHHIDNNPQNNHHSNLELFASNADHLASTLKGQVPNWTEDGKRRISEGVRASNARRAASRAQLEIDAGQ